MGLDLSPQINCTMLALYSSKEPLAPGNRFLQLMKEFMARTTETAKTTLENNAQIGQMKKNNRAARATRTLVEFSDVVCANDISKFQ